MATAQIISLRKGLWMHELYSTRVEAPNTTDDCHNDFVILNPQGRLGDDERQDNYLAEQCTYCK